MIEKFECEGYWWLPEKPEMRVLGNLRYNQQEGVVLEVFDPGIGFIDFSKDLYKTILGLSKNAQRITLYNLVPSKTGKLNSLYNCTEGTQIPVKVLTNRFDLEAEIALIGYEDRFEDPENTLKRIKKLTASLSYLQEWTWIFGFNGSIIPDQENSVKIEHKNPSPINIGEFKDLGLTIDFGLPRKVSLFSVTMEQTTFLKIENTKNKHLNDLVDLVTDFCEFLSFAITKPVQILSLTGILDIEGSNSIKILGRWPINRHLHQNHQNIDPSLMLFAYRDVQDDLENIFRNWLRIKDDLKILIELISINIYASSLYVEYQFLNIIQALEYYCPEGKYLSKESYNDGIKKEMLDLIKKYPSETNDQNLGITDEFREVLENKLNFMNQLTLKSKLNKILERVGLLLPDNFISNEEEFVQKSTQIRNALTHHNHKKRQNLPNAQELHNLTCRWTLILQACLLQDLGFSDEKIKALVRRYNHYHLSREELQEEKVISTRRRHRRSNRNRKRLLRRCRNSGREYLRRYRRSNRNRKRLLRRCRNSGREYLSRI